MAKGTNYSLIFQGQIDVTSINKQIQEIQQRLNNLEFNFGGSAKNIGEVSNSLGKVKKNADEAGSSTENLGEKMQATQLTFQAANEIFSKSVDIINSMFNQVLELDTALTEFQKVSDLSNDALDNYVTKLTQMGSTVARTGKPNRSEPECMDRKHALRTSLNPVNPKALKATA